MPYDKSTWETSTLVGELAQHEIDRYLNRVSKSLVSNKREANPHTRAPYEAFREQPSYIKYGTLRDFQIKGVNFLAHNWCKGNNVILADEMGLGKTVQTVAFINWLRHERQQQGPFIVVVPLSTMSSWAETFDNWTPDINYVVYNGGQPARSIIRETELLVDGNPLKTKFNVLLTTYEFILADASFLSQIKWQFMAVDEAHRLKNRESQLYARLLEFNAPSRLLITGTPVQNTLGELSALMDFLMPGRAKIEENIDYQSEQASKKIDELHKTIKPYILRRTKNTVESDLPPKTEKIIRVDVANIQKEYLKNIHERNYAALNQGVKGPKQSLLNIMMETKKACNHPYLLANAEERILNGSHTREDELKGIVTSSGKMMLLDQLLAKLKKENHRVLIFSQMVKMLDILSDYLRLRGYQYQRLDGTIASGPRKMAMDHFNAPNSDDFCFLLSTRAGGLGINLMTADTVVLFDSDWNPQADLQAMARAHRIGQTKPVNVYRLVSKETIEEEILERARNKLMLEFITIQRGVTDMDPKVFTDRMERASRSVNEPNSSEDIQRILKKRAQKMFDQTDNQKKLEELDIDAVLEDAELLSSNPANQIENDGGEEFLKSFDYIDVKLDLTWDDIIPKDRLEVLKAEEKTKADDLFLKEQIELSGRRKRKQDDNARSERAAKKRARDTVALEAAAEESDANPGQDPRRPLEEREVRNLLHGYSRYGSLEERRQDVLTDARLLHRDFEVVKATLEEVVGLAQDLWNAECARIDALEKAGQKVVTKKDRKAILFDFRGAKRLNAQTITERPDEMRLLKQAVGAISDWTKFRIPEASKGAQYSTEWGAREDGMLCVGIVRHGYGAWVPIRDDPELGLRDKFFLEEHRVGKKEERTKNDEKDPKSPGAVHLVRRADYLISVLKAKIRGDDDPIAKRALENHHRNNKKGHGRHGRHGRGENRPSDSASPAPSAVRNGQRNVNGNRGPRERRFSNGDRVSKPQQREKTSSNHHTKAENSRKGHDQSMDNQVSNEPYSRDLMKLVFGEIIGSLERIQGAKKEHIPDKNQRALVLRTELAVVGDFMKELKNRAGSLERPEKFERDLWYALLLSWTKVKLANSN